MRTIFLIGGVIIVLSAFVMLLRTSIEYAETNSLKVGTLIECLILHFIGVFVLVIGGKISYYYVIYYSIVNWDICLIVYLINLNNKDDNSGSDNDKI